MTRVPFITRGAAGLAGRKAVHTHRRRSAILLVAAVGTLTSGLGAPARAQGFGWFGNLFGGGSPRPLPGAPAYPGYGRVYNPQQGNGVEPPHRVVRRRRAVDPAIHEAREHPPKNASSFVYVFGDSMGQMLANGLDESLADRSDVAVLHRAKAGTGLDDPESFDWLAAVDQALATHSADDRAKTADRAGKSAARPSEPINVGVVMIGTNDRRPMEVDGKTLEFGSPEWTAQYRKRVTAIDEAFRKKGIALIWVGLPIARDDAAADDMAALNDIYREVAAKEGAVYVDTWEAFSDDDGDFSASGPDVDGRTVRLRSADGVGFTRAGGRKLAHFVEAHISRVLDGKSGPSIDPSIPSAAAGKSPAVSGGVENLNDVPRTKGGDLVAVSPPSDAKPLQANVSAGNAIMGDAAAQVDAAAGPVAPAQGRLSPASPSTIPADRADNPAWDPTGRP